MSSRPRLFSRQRRAWNGLWQTWLAGRGRGFAERPSALGGCGSSRWSTGSCFRAVGWQRRRRGLPPAPPSTSPPGLGIVHRRDRRSRSNGTPATCPPGARSPCATTPTRRLDGNETWITYSQPANTGYGAYNWNTTGVTPGTYYIGGYLYANGSPIYSHLTSRGDDPGEHARVHADRPDLGHVLHRADHRHPMDRRQRARREHDRPGLRHRHRVQRNVTWITYNQPAANGSGSYNWNTTGVTPGMYYVAGYLYANGTRDLSHIMEPITLQTAPSTPTFTLLGPTSGTFTAGQTVQIVWNAGNVPVGGTIALGYDTGTSFNNVTWITLQPARQQRLRQLRLEHHRRAGGHVLHRRLSLFGRQADLLPPHPVVHDPGGPGADLHADRSDLGHVPAGQPVTIQWTAANVPDGSTIALGYDTGTSFSNVTWITFNQTGVNGNGTYSWDTTGVTPGTYYIAGYLYAGGKPTYSHLTQSFTIQPAPAPTFILGCSDLRNVHRRANRPDPVAGRQRRGRQHDRPGLRHGHFVSAT